MRCLVGCLALVGAIAGLGVVDVVGGVLVIAIALVASGDGCAPHLDRDEELVLAALELALDGPAKEDVL